MLNYRIIILCEIYLLFISYPSVILRMRIDGHYLKRSFNALCGTVARKFVFLPLDLVSNVSVIASANDPPIMELKCMFVDGISV